DGGRFAVKRIEGDPLVVEADVFADGHDSVACALRWRRADEPIWSEVPMTALGNDRWRGELTCGPRGRYRYSIVGWVDHFGTWRQDLQKRIAAGQDVSVEVLIGAGFVEDAARAARAGAGRNDAAAELEAWATRLRATASGADGLDPELAALMEANPDRTHVTESPE